MKSRLVAVALVAGFCVALAAQADAHGRVNHRFLRGYYGEHAVVTGTVISATATSFTANAYVVTPGAGGSSSTPTKTQVTITPGANTKVIVNGQKGAPISSIAAGDTFYAVYRGVSSTTDIATITNGTPVFVSAFMPPTPKFVVRGTITAAPTAANPDQFTATATIVQPCSHGRHGFGHYRHRHEGVGYSYGCRIDGFHLGDDVGGDYGYSKRHRRHHSKRHHGHHSRAHAARRHAHHHRRHNRGHHHGRRHHGRHHRGHHHRAASTTTPTTGVVITVDTNTKFAVNGNHNATVSDLQVGQHFVAVFSGSPSTASLSNLPPALSVCARTVYQRYGFIGTVTATDTTDTPNTVTVNVTGSMPSGMFTGTETFTIGSDTHVHAPSGHSLSDVAVGDTVAGGVIAPAGETAAQIESTPLGFLADPPRWGGDHVSRHAKLAHLRRLLRHHHGHVRH